MWVSGVLAGNSRLNAHGGALEKPRLNRA
jgi:hypothetical protein